MVPFLFTIHNHQPVGNFSHVFKRAFSDCYDPFLKMMSAYENVKFSIHYSGSLLEWIEQNRPEHIEIIQILVKKGQAEILGGGFMEPILTSIPYRDAKAQIGSYLDHLEGLFQTRPKGIWIAERVWDPSLPVLFNELGVEFTLVDDSHFRYAGISEKEAWGPHIAEREGKTVLIFPIDKNLRYKIPFSEPEETISYITKRAEETPDFVACYGDDGEKFGLWPDTKEWVFDKGWLNRFLKTLSASEKVKTIHFADYLKNAKPRARIFMPPASYEEMMEWALPPKLGENIEDLKKQLKKKDNYPDIAPFIRGGHWDMFLTKYEESNRMQKRMLLASDRIAKIKNPPEKAIKALHRSQCNCAYWHGVFGGLYINYLRDALYRQIMEAESLAGLGKELSIEQLDYDKDGHEEIIVSSPDINLIVSPRKGGSILSIEYPEKRFALGNVLSRRRETYHRKLKELKNDGPETDAPATIHDIVKVKEDGLEKRLVYDRFPRVNLQDHIIPKTLALEEIESEQTLELADLPDTPYDVIEISANEIIMKKETLCQEVLLVIQKKLTFKKGHKGFSAEYDIISEGKQKLDVLFAVEWNLTLLDGMDPDRHYLINKKMPYDPAIGQSGTHIDVSQLSMVDRKYKFKLTISPSHPQKVCRFPIETVSQSEEGFEKTYQGSAIWFASPLKLGPGEKFNLKLDFSLQNL